MTEQRGNLSRLRRKLTPTRSALIFHFNLFNLAAMFSGWFGCVCERPAYVPTTEREMKTQPKKRRKNIIMKYNALYATLPARFSREFRPGFRRVGRMRGMAMMLVYEFSSSTFTTSKTTPKHITTVARGHTYEHTKAARRETGVGGTADCKTRNRCLI